MQQLNGMIFNNFGVFICLDYYQQESVCGGLMRVVYRVSKESLCIFARRVLHWVGSGRFSYIKYFGWHA